MDPTTQRMLERARARRQKLDEQLSHVDRDAPTTRNTLHESNPSQVVKVTTEVEVMLSQPDSIQKVNISPSKVEIHGIDEEKENTCNVNISQPCKTETGGSGNSPVRTITRSQLKRLGALYSDSQISSPIHRTENDFAVEEVPKAVKSTARVARFAALANNIRQWEDDLSHPARVPSSQDDIKDVDSKKEVSSQSVSNETDVEVTPKNAGDNQSAPRKIVWDKKLLANLDNGERPSSSHQGSVSSTKPSCKDLGKANAEKSIGHSKVDKLVKDEDHKEREVTHCSPMKMNTPERHAEASTSSPKKADLNISLGKKLSPRKDITRCSPQTGSVLHKASYFESISPTKKSKDPAELSVSERMALFERNKGEALVPKAAFSMPVPAKYLDGSDQSKVPKSAQDKGKQAAVFSKNKPTERWQKPVHAAEAKKDSAAESNVPPKVLVHREMFERGALMHETQRIQSVQNERQKDLEMLRNRWNKNKDMASEPMDKGKTVNQGPIIPSAPPLPKGDASPVKISPPVLRSSPVKITAPALPSSPVKVTPPVVTQMIPKMMPSKQSSPAKISHLESRNEAHRSSHSSSKLEEQYRGLCKVKKVKVSPPKPGHLYPCLSDIEATTTEAETETETQNEYEGDSMSSCGSESAGDTSFGREILEAAGINKSPVKMVSNISDSSDISSVLDEMDGFLDEALGDDSSSESEQDEPTPPKRSRDCSRSPKKTKASPTTRTSKSFRYTAGDSPLRSPTRSPAKPERHNIPLHVVEGDQEMPLMHSVSFYRRQQNLALKTPPARQIVRQPEICKALQEESSSRVDESEEVTKKVTNLLDEVSRQQTVISQTSQALNFCTATVEFSESAEQVEAERVLLLATHKRQAALHEIQRLKVEGTLKPASGGMKANTSLDKGSLLISKIVLPLKKEYIRALTTATMCHHFVCLVRCQEQVLMTKVQVALLQTLEDKQNLVWNACLRLVDLYSDFKVTLEVYVLQTAREVLPHNIKYHIGNKKETGKSWLTPKKLLKQESHLIMPAVQSPAGPSAVKSPQFQMAGYVVFSLRELQRAQFVLNKVSYTSPLEGNIQLKMSSELSIDVCERGFLTMFEDVSGFGAWHRRWFVLKGSVLAYWKYPDDEKKIPIGQIDLNSCRTESVGLVSRDICARPNTFVLETTRPLEPDDKDSLVLVKCQNQTIIRNLLSADTKEERIVWCNQLNKALTLLRAWGGSAKD